MQDAFGCGVSGRASPAPGGSPQLRATTPGGRYRHTHTHARPLCAFDPIDNLSIDRARTQHRRRTAAHPVDASLSPCSLPVSLQARARASEHPLTGATHRDPIGASIPSPARWCLAKGAREQTKKATRKSQSRPRHAPQRPLRPSHHRDASPRVQRHPPRLGPASIVAPPRARRRAAVDARPAARRLQKR
jgi:hypothetical protein